MVMGSLDCLVLLFALGFMILDTTSTLVDDLALYGIDWL